MQNLFKLLFRFRRFLFFLVLQGLSLLLISKHFLFQQVVLSGFTSKITGSFWEGYRDFTLYLNLKKEVDALREENARLRGHLLESKWRVYGDTWPRDTVFQQAYAFLPARVLHISTNLRSNFFTLDAGSLHGVRSGMGVMAPEGVVGVITQVSQKFSGGISLLNANSEMQLSVQLKKTGEYGTLVWDGDNPCCAWVENVGSSVPVNAGDTVITSRLSTIFPQGFGVGTAIRTEEIPNQPGQRIYLRLFAPYARLHSVYVVDYLWQSEQDSLEEEVRKL